MLRRIRYSKSISACTGPVRSAQADPAGVTTIQTTTLFIGLTREVAFAGLPIMYLVVLICVVMLGFIFTGSFIYFILMSGVGYTALRALAAYDPKIIDVFIATMKSTRMSPGLLKGEGVVYRA